MVALPASSLHSLWKTSLLFSQILGQIKYTKITLETEKESLASNLALEQDMQPGLVSRVKSRGWNPGRVSAVGTAGSPWLLGKQLSPLFVVARITTFFWFCSRLGSWEFTYYTLQLAILKLSRKERARRSWAVVAQLSVGQCCSDNSPLLSEEAESNNFIWIRDPVSPSKVFVTSGMFSWVIT